MIFLVLIQRFPLDNTCINFTKKARLKKMVTLKIELKKKSLKSLEKL